MDTNKLYCDDNLEIMMRYINNNSVNLITMKELFNCE